MFPFSCCPWRPDDPARLLGLPSLKGSAIAQCGVCSVCTLGILNSDFDLFLFLFVLWKGIFEIVVLFNFEVLFRKFVVLFHLVVLYSKSTVGAVLEFFNVISH